MAPCTAQAGASRPTQRGAKQCRRAGGSQQARQALGARLHQALQPQVQAAGAQVALHMWRVEQGHQLLRSTRRAQGRRGWAGQAAAACASVRGRHAKWGDQRADMAAAQQCSTSAAQGGGGAAPGAGRPAAPSAARAAAARVWRRRA